MEVILNNKVYSAVSLWCLHCYLEFFKPVCYYSITKKHNRARFLSIVLISLSHLYYLSTWFQFMRHDELNDQIAIITTSLHISNKALIAYHFRVCIEVYLF